MTRPLLVTACDSGTANYLIPVLPRLHRPWILVAQDPAVERLRAAGLAVTETPRGDWGGLAALGESVVGGGDYAAVLCGTSWGPTLDKTATLAARRRGLSCTAIVEHWSLYRERFSRVDGGVLQDADAFLPDEIWVNDAEAVREAVAAGLPADRLRALGQPHLEAQGAALATRKERPDGRTVVFVSERIRADFVPDSPMDPGFDEFEALEGLLSVLPEGKTVTVKQHPQELADKYDIVAARDPRVTVVGVCDLGALVAGAERIVGMVSMLLLEAALIRPDVISFLPGGDPDGFIGNRIGATRCATTLDDLRRLLAAPRAAASTDFGARFAGSAARIAAAIEEDVAACA